MTWEAVPQIPVELRPVDIRNALKIAGLFNVYAYNAYVLECAGGEIQDSPGRTTGLQLDLRPGLLLAPA